MVTKTRKQTATAAAAGAKAASTSPSSEATTKSAKSKAKSPAKGSNRSGSTPKAKIPTASRTSPQVEGIPATADDKQASAPATKVKPSINVPTIPVFDFDLPLELDYPYGSRISAFNPAPYEGLRRKLQQWFPNLLDQSDDQSEELPQQSTVDASQDNTPKTAKSKAKSTPTKSQKSAASAKSSSTVKPTQSKRKGKSKQPDYVHLEVEFVPQLVSDFDLRLPRTSRGWSGAVSPKPHQALAVVALAPPDYKPDITKPTRRSSTRVSNETKDEDEPMSEDDPDDTDTLLLGYVIPSALKDAAHHPLAHLEAILLAKEWIQLYGEVTLAPPFLPPESEIFGPDAFETSSKRGLTAAQLFSGTVKTEPGLDSLTDGKGDLAQDAPRITARGADVPSTRLLGVLSVQVGLESAALQYGAGQDDVDGFVASNADLKNTAAEGSLGLARALRQAIPSIVDWEHSYIELDMDAHTFWERNESFYELPPRQTTLARHLVLDKVESLDLPTTANSKSVGKKRKKLANASRVPRASLLTSPFPAVVGDEEEEAVRLAGTTCGCPTCRASWPETHQEVVLPRPLEPPRPKLDALPLGEQIASTDARLGDVNNEKYLPLDTNVASLLEACRPPPNGPKVYPPSDVIPTPLLGYQARCLAWMIKRETIVDEDAGLLMPNWFPLRCKSAGYIMQKRLQLEREREALLDAMQRGLSRSRRTANVKAAQVGARAAITADTSNPSTTGGMDPRGPLKREPFIDPADQVFYFDQVSGLLSLRRFCCRPREPGGALCESMGLGKTLESLSLIAAHPRPDNPNLLEYDTSRSARMIAELDPSERPFVSRATLVVCPAALVEQWMDEIRKHFRSRSTVDPDSLDGADGLNRQAGVVRYRHADFAWDVRSRRAHVRALAEKKLTKPDIVVATYEELASQLSESHRVPPGSDQVRTPLLEVLFWRILLDEAQIVAGASGKATNMVHELWRSNCWMVTGTPVTKGIRDIQGIFAFLDHDPLAAPRFFREILQQPFSQGCVEGIRRLRAILPRFVWRHTQAHVEDEIVLPPCNSEVLEIDLKHVERLFYDKEVSKFRESFAKQAARGVATVAQPTFLVHLRQLLSHPQVADEYLYFHNYSRLSFAELFRRFFQQAESELATIRMQVVTITLQLVWGHDFYTAETDKRRWRGGVSPLHNSEAICQVLNAALLVVTKALEEQASASVASSPEMMQETEGTYAELQATEVDNPSAVAGPSTTDDPETSATDIAEASLDADVDKASASTSAARADVAAQATSGGTDSTARVNLTWEEANYWLQTLLRRHADGDPASDGESATRIIEPPARWDPERPSRTCFDKEFKNADDPSVDLKDPRYHPVVQDAGAEDMDEDEYLSQLAAERHAASSSDAAGPRKKVKMDAAFQPGLLKKARLRGKASQRQIGRVWLYKPKERLDTTYAKLVQQQAALPGKEHEVAFLRQQLLESLGGETRPHFGAGASSANAAAACTAQAPGPECQICFEPKMQIGVLPCYHSFCADCIDMICEKSPRSAVLGWTNYNKPRCPKCRLGFLPDRVTRIMERGRSASIDGTETVVGDWSGKISGLIMDLKARLERDPTHKAVVFSHWPKMLNFVCDALVQNDVPAVVFGGNEAKQAEALRAIRDDHHIKVILVPFRASAGAAGLTLTSCDLAYLMEPALDAALEAQAVGRIHRIGQRRETTILRVKMKDTIEDAVMRIADERSRRGMALAAHADPAVAVPTASSEAAATAAGPSTAAGGSSVSSSRQAGTSANPSEAAPSVRIKTEEQGPLESVPSTASLLRERSIKSSVAASVGVGRESDSVSLTMAEVGLILGFDVEEEKRKAKERRESVLRRAGYSVYMNVSERELNELELDLAMEEEDEMALQEEEWGMEEEEMAMEMARGYQDDDDDDDESNDEAIGRFR